MKRNKKLNKWLMTLLLLAIVIIILRQFILYNIPEIIPLGYEIGELLFNLSIGYIVTYLFYYLTIYRREIKTQEKAYEFSKKRVENINKAFYSIIHSICKTKNISLLDLLKDENLPEKLYGILSTINPNSFSGRMNKSFVSEKWHYSLESNVSKIKTNIDELLIVFSYLDLEDIELMMDIISSNYILYIENMDLTKFRDLSDLTNPILELHYTLLKINKNYSIDVSEFKFY